MRISLLLIFFSLGYQASALPVDAFVKLAEKVNPTVVNISTKRRPSDTGNRQRLGRDPLFDMFDRFMGENFTPPMPREFQALGTGFIIRKDGLILTNAHVIEGADVIQVTLMNTPEVVYEAELIGRDRRTDIALIKISGKKDFPVAPLGNSKKVQVGQWVAAFGNPYGHSNTMTKGIISAVGRKIDDLNRLPFLQTDASINQGNSGGPLVNLEGAVIGVNTAIDARAQGIGFAIPIDNIKALLGELEKTGFIQRGFIGVRMSPIDRRIATNLGLKQTRGVLVVDVEPGSPAERAGIRGYDVITFFADTEIESMGDLQTAVGDTPAGKKRKIRVLRDGKVQNLEITVGSRNPPTQALRKPRKGGQQAPHNLGFRVSKLSSKLAHRNGLDNSYIGRPIVIGVNNSSPAHMAGLLAGDLIIDANRKPVKSVKDLFASLQNGSNLIKLLRGDRTLIILVES